MAEEKSEETVEVNLNQFHECIDTWIPSERKGYRLYLNEDLQSGGPSDEYVLTEYSHRNSSGMIIAMGSVDISPEVPVIADVNGVLKSMDLTPLTDSQWCTVAEAYAELTERVLRDQIFEGVPQIYQAAVYHEVDDFQAAMEQYVDDLHNKIEKYEAEQEEEKERTYYDEYSEYGRLGDDQYHNIGRVLERALEWEHKEKVPYAQHCQLAAVLEFDPYEDWEIRAIEYLHNSVLVNKPELAKTMALLEKGLSQKEIAEKLGKSQSTVSRQVSQINEWERRSEWMIQQNDE